MSTTQAPPKRVRRIVPLLVVGLVVVLGVWLFFHRTRLPPQQGRDNKAVSQEAGIQGVTEALRKEPTLTVCQNVQQQLNSYIGRHPDQQPPSLSAEQRALLQKQVGLTQAEVDEVGSTTFTQLDPHYLEACFLLSDALRSLDLEGLSARDKAVDTFAWVVRQVRLREADGPAAPPQYVLRRGSGSALERSLVFLAALDQLGIPGCMVGFRNGGQITRYWIPGALVDGQIYLFDTRLGVPLPGPKGEGIATLGQLRSQFDQLTAVPTGDVTPLDAAQAEPCVACSLTALAPRMRYLQERLGTSARARLTADPAALLDAFRQATTGPEFKGCGVTFWNPPGKQDSSVRVLQAFLPPMLGGTDERPRDSTGPWRPRRESFDLALTPWPRFPAPFQELPENSDPGATLRRRFSGRFREFTLGDGQPRDLMLRGRIDEAVNALVEKRGEADRLRDRSREEKDLNEKVARWLAEARQAHADLLRARRDLLDSKNPNAQAVFDSAAARVNKVWDGRVAEKPNLLLLFAVAEPLGIEATYLLALCKQEMAERTQARLNRTRAPSKEFMAEAVRAWQATADLWGEYRMANPNGPAEIAARQMQARALAALGRRAAAEDLLRTAPVPAGSWDQRGCEAQIRSLPQPSITSKD